MKVVSSKVMSELEGMAYRQNFTEKEFMEKAGKGIALAALDFLQTQQCPRNIYLLCGKGNNAGDAFVAGCYLLDQNCQVTAIQWDGIEDCSPLCQENQKRFLQKKGILIRDFNAFQKPGIILDGIFGTGFKGAVRSPYNSLIEAANQSGLPILAIDIPSGLNGTTGEIEGSVIHATETIFLGLPKSGFFLGNGWNTAGKLRKVNFGLPDSIIQTAAADFELMEREDIVPLLPPIQRNRHKYQAGSVIGFAGSLHMSGAGLLSSLAAFRGGCGIVRLFYPDGMESALSSAPYELIKTPYHYDKPETVFPYLQKAGAVYIGPGIGLDEKVLQFLQALMPHLTIPCVLDADALTLYAKKPFCLPSQTIFTPHLGEMQTLLKSTSRLVLNSDLLKICQSYAEEHAITLILKGAPTFIFHPQTPINANPTGDPGMATAGSGDVLTGLLASLLSQGLSCLHAAQVGVYLHGLSGELAKRKRKTSRGMMATDLIAQFDEAYRTLD